LRNVARKLSAKYVKRPTVKQKHVDTRSLGSSSLRLELHPIGVRTLIMQQRLLNIFDFSSNTRPTNRSINLHHKC